MSDKATVLQQLDTEYRSFRDLVAGLSDEQMAEVWFGSWGVREILAHISGWQREMAAAAQRLARGERPTPEGVSYDDADAWNARFATGAAAQRGREALRQWEQAYGGYVAALEQVPDDRWGEGRAINRIAQASGWGHFREHAGPIRQWLGKH